MTQRYDDDFTFNARPMPAASLWNTFQTAAQLIRLSFWIVCLPPDLLLHARVGKRYMNTAFVGLSIFVLSLISAVALAVAAALPTVQWGDGEEMRSIQLRVPGFGQCIPFAGMLIATGVAFACQYVGNRRRFGTASQGHSFDVGLSWLGYLGKFLPSNSRRDDAGPLELADSSVPPPIPGDGGSRAVLRESVAYPLAVAARCRLHVDQHMKKLRSGEAPHGPFNWFLISFAEPAILLALGIGLCCLSETQPFGFYLVMLAVALFGRGQMTAADFRDRIYQDRDSEIELAAMRNLRDGAPLDQVSRAYTVPISKAIIPARRIVNSSVSGPGVDSQRTMGELYDSRSTPPSAQNGHAA